MSRDTLEDNPFTYRVLKDSRVQVFRAGRLAVTLSGKEAIRTCAKLERADERTSQLILAKVTGQYKFGNEKKS